MEYKIFWVPLAVETYMEEIDFIYLKWNQKEVDDFVMLVDENLKRLSINPLIGQIHKNVYKIVISKQTSLFYKITEKDKKVELVYFWNNKKDSQ
jgi:hemerythrin